MTSDADGTFQRLVIESRDDPTIYHLSWSSRWVWITCLIAARHSPRPGVLLAGNGVPLSVADVAALAHVPSSQAHRIVNDLLASGVLSSDGKTLRVTAWGEAPGPTVITFPANSFRSWKEHGEPEFEREERRGTTGGGVEGASHVVDSSPCERDTSYVLKATSQPSTVDRTSIDRGSARLSIEGPPVQPTQMMFVDVAVEAKVPKNGRASAPLPGFPELVDALGAEFNASTRPEWVKIAVAVKIMLAATPPVEPHELPELVAAWSVVFPGASCTAMALANNVGLLRRGKGPRGQRRETPEEQSTRLLGRFIDDA